MVDSRNKGAAFEGILSSASMVFSRNMAFRSVASGTLISIRPKIYVTSRFPVTPSNVKPTRMVGGFRKVGGNRFVMRPVIAFLC